MAAYSNDRLKQDLSAAFALLPAQSLDRLSCIHSFNANSLRRWCEQLNVLNISTAAPSLICVFRELAAARLGAKDAFNLYTVVRPTLALVRDAIHSAYNKKYLQLTSQSKQTMELAHSLDRAVILMLKSILVDCLQMQLMPKVHHLAAMIGCHLFVYLSESYVRLNEFCISVVNGFWQECHSIYWFLAQCSCEALELESAEFKKYPSSFSVKALYKGLLLYAIADPCKYDRTIQFDLFHMMIVLSSGTDLEEQPVNQGLFAVILTEDLSHVPQRAIQDQAQLGVLYFNVSGMIKGLKAWPSHDFILTDNSRLARLRESFIETFTVEKYRKEQRQDVTQHVQCYFGLVQIHLFLPAADQVDVKDEQDFYARAPLGYATLSPEELVVKDSSDGGYCLETLKHHRLRYGAGDLVLILIDNMMVMCIIRWSRLQPSSQYLFGIEKLTDDVIAVEFSVMHGGVALALDKGLLFKMQKRVVILSRIAVHQGQSLQLKEAVGRKIYGVTEVHWLVSGYVQAILKPLG